MTKYCVILFILLSAFSAFLGYYFAEKEFRKEKMEWISKERESIRKELINQARKNYENYIRIHGIDSMDYDQRVEWLLSNRAYE